MLELFAMINLHYVFFQHFLSSGNHERSGNEPRRGGERKPVAGEVAKKSDQIQSYFGMIYKQL